MQVKCNGSVDIGFGCTKAIVDNNIWVQPSILGEAHQLFDENIREDDIQYHKNGKDYFIGNLALRHSHLKYAGTSENKATNWTTKILLETSLGIIAPQYCINLITGLPVDFYLKQKKDMEILLGTFNDNSYYTIQQGQKNFINARPYINKYKIIPQPLGAAMNYLLDEHGTMLRLDIAKKKILIIDIGYYTLDLLILDGMEIGKESGSPSGLGVDTVYRLVQEDLKEHFGKSPNRYELDQYIKNGIYNGYNINPLVNKAFKILGTQITQEIETLNMTFDKYILTGGCTASIQEYINLPKEKCIIYDQLGNVKGYKKIGARTWGEVL